MPSSKTRREFLVTAGTGVAVGMMSRGMGWAQTPGVRTRKNFVSAAAQNDVNSLRKGVDEMKKLITTKPTDPRGWVLQSFIHGNCTNFTFCQHGNWYFAPWHRSFIYYFEKLIQFFSKDNNFALPYWDWSRTHSIPASFYTPPGGAVNPLDDTVKAPCSGSPSPGRGRTVSQSFSQADLDTYVGSAVINRIQSNPDYATWGGTSFGGGEIERTPHNFVHRWVGGSKFSNMVQTYSPLDPIFWMHHCNIDRLYSNWMARSGHNTPPETAWKNKSFNDFYDKDGKRVGSEFTCERSKDSRNMGYVYDLQLKSPTALSVPKATKQAILGSVSAAKGSAKAGVLSFAPEGAAAGVGQPIRGLDEVLLGEADHVVRLRIDGVKTPKQQNTGVHVFLGPNITPDTPLTAPGYVGSFTFFNNPAGGEGGGGHDHGTAGVLLNATEAVRNLYSDIGLKDVKLSVSLVTKPLYQGVSAYGAVEEISPDRVQIDVVDLVA